MATDEGYGRLDGEGTKVREHDRRRQLAAGIGGGWATCGGAFTLRGALAAALGLWALIWPGVSLGMLLRLVDQRRG